MCVHDGERETEKEIGGKRGTISKIMLIPFYFPEVAPGSAAFHRTRENSALPESPGCSPPFCIHPLVHWTVTYQMPCVDTCHRPGAGGPSREPSRSCVLLEPPFREEQIPTRDTGQLRPMLGGEAWERPVRLHRWGRGGGCDSPGLSSVTVCRQGPG